MSPQVKRGRYYNAYRGGIKPKVAPVVKKYVKKCMDRVVEKKYADGNVSISATAPGAVGADYLCGITLGTSDQQRVGNNIIVTKIILKGRFETPTTANNGDYRLVCGWDRQPNGGSPTNTDILATSAAYSNYNHNWVVGSGGGRYDITCDRRKVWNSAIASTAQKYPFTYTWTGRKIVRFYGNAGTVSDMATNNFFVLVEDAAATGVFAGRITIEYQDA